MNRLAIPSLGIILLFGATSWCAPRPPVAAPIHVAALSPGASLLVFDRNGRLLEKRGISPVFSGLAVGDVDGDGEDETIVGNAEHMEIRDVAGILRATFDRSTAFFPFLATGDLDGDGRDELIAPEIASNRLKILSIGSPLESQTAFESVVDPTFFEPISGLAAGDVNGDGRDEILLAQFRTVPLIVEDRVVIYDGDGNELNYFDVGEFARIASGDVTGDGVDEIVVARPEHVLPPFGRREIFIWDGAGNQVGFFATSADADPGFPLTDVAVGDVDNDGVDEIIVGNGAGGGAIIYNGTGTEIGRVGPSHSIAGSVVLAVGRRAYPDNDRDGLLDRWERDGVDVDGVHVDLPGFGADPQHKDVFVEYDWLPGFEPTQDAIQTVKESFALAPVDAGGTPNPDGQPGINLWVDTGGLVDPQGHEGASAAPATCSDGIDNDGDSSIDGADRDCLVGDDFGGGGPLAGVPADVCPWNDFYNAKRNHFSASRSGIFRYATRAQCRPNPNVGGIAELGGNDFMIFLPWAHTFMHELGHTLFLSHGGPGCDTPDTPSCNDEHFNACKPNYLSVMNYNTQLKSNGFAALLQLEPDGEHYRILIDYSPPRLPTGGRGAAPLPTLVETDLAEPPVLDASDQATYVIFRNALGFLRRALVGQPIDWSGDGSPVQSGVTANIDNIRRFCQRTDVTGSTLNGHDDWRNIRLPFRQFGDSADFAVSPFDEPAPTPADLEAIQAEVNTADLALEKAAAPDPVRAGEELVYTLTAKNWGPNPALDVQVVDTLPPGVEFLNSTVPCVEAPAGTLSCDVGVLQPGVSRAFDVTVGIPRAIVQATGGPVTLTNSASVTNLVGPDPDLRNNTDTAATLVLPVAVNVVRARVYGSPPGSASGQVSLMGDILTDPASGDTFAPAAGLTVRVRDDLALDVTRRWEPGECVVQGGGHIRCRNADGSARARIRAFRSAPALYRFNLTLHRLTASPPFQGPVVVTLTDGGTVREGRSDVCRAAANAGLVCRTPGL